MGVQSDGSYGVDRSLFYSFPVVVDPPGGAYRVVGGLDLDTDTTAHVARTTTVLRAELDEAIAVDDQLPAASFDDVAAAAAAEPAAAAAAGPVTA